jgi:hypothetical protein
MNVTVMSKGKEITTALTVLGKVPNPPIVQQKTEDSAKPVHEDNKEEGAWRSIMNQIHLMKVNSPH